MAIYLTIKRSSLTGGKKPFGGKQPKFVEGQHTRDSHGRFSSKPGGKSPKPQEIRSNSTKPPDTGRPREGGQLGWDSDDPIGTVVRAHCSQKVKEAKEKWDNTAYSAAIDNVYLAQSARDIAEEQYKKALSQGDKVKISQLFAEYREKDDLTKRAFQEYQVEGNKAAEANSGR